MHCIICIDHNIKNRDCVNGIRCCVGLH